MKVLLGLDILLGFGFAIAAAPLAPLLELPTGAQSADGYIVVLKDGSDPTSIIDSLKINQVTNKVYRNALPGFSGKFDAATLALIREQPAVAYIEHDTITRISATQSHPPYGLSYVSNTYNQKVYNYNAAAGKGITAYVVDSGIYTKNVDFEGRASFGYNGVDKRDTDENSHGTHVAGTVGGKTYGVAKLVKLVAVKVVGADGSGSQSGTADGLDWIAGHANFKACVINISLGGGHSNAVDNMIQRLYQKGCSIAVAAGNEDDEVTNQSPADAPNAVTVGAANRTLGRAYFSNYGNKVDIFAPGTHILSCGIAGPESTAFKSGTSMASPTIAGLMAYLLSIDTNHEPAHITQKIISLSRKGIIKDTKGSPNRFIYNGFK